MNHAPTTEVAPRSMRIVWVRERSNVMRCRRCSARSQALLDGCLRETEAAQVRKHLDACPACRAAFAALAALDGALAAEPRVQPPPAMTVAIVNQAARSLRRRPVLIPVWLEALTFAGLGLTLAGTAVMGLTVAKASGVAAVAALSPVGVVVAIVCGGLALFGSVYYGAQL